LVEGLLTALSELDEVISILRQASDGSTAKITQSRFNLSEESDAILAMPLRRLTGLERQNLQREEDQLNQQIQLLRQLLSDRRELLKALKKTYDHSNASGDPRRTKLAKSTQETGEKETGDRRQRGRQETRKLNPKSEEAVLEFTQRSCAPVSGQWSAVS